jgi:hypothetical protein
MTAVPVEVAGAGAGAGVRVEGAVEVTRATGTRRSAAGTVIPGAGTGALPMMWMNGVSRRYVL